MKTFLSPQIIIGVIAAYFLMLIAVSYLTSKDDNNENFFTASRKSPWLLVAIGMIGTSLSGVTLISIPGVVGAGGYNQGFSYMQMVFGYLIGYAFIALVLMPVYYRLNLTSIYEYLADRFGPEAHKIGAFYFLLSRIVGASLRLFLVAIVLHRFVTEPLGLPFFLTVMVTIALIWVYTFRGGIKTIVWTDTLQTLFLITAVIMTIIAIGNAMDTNISGMVSLIKESDYNQWFFFDKGWNDPNNFFKQFISGALIAIVMTGLDQDMMQKNLTCKSLGEAQKNMFTFSFILIFANILFLSLGALLYIYANSNGIAIPEKTDQLYPVIALEYLSPIIGIFFILGLVAAAYSSADSALTSLTTSFCVDFLGMEKDEVSSAKDKKRTRIFVHIGFSVLLFIVILVFHAINNQAIINDIFKYAGYTYGPLLGLFIFGIFTKWEVNDGMGILAVCIIAPLISIALNEGWLFDLGNFGFGSIIIAVNGLLTFLGLWVLHLVGKHAE